MAECDRCVRPTKATATSTVALNDATYRLKLCESHADALSRDVLAWTRLGELVEEAEREPHRAFAAERDRARALARLPAPPPQGPRQAAPRAEQMTFVPPEDVYRAAHTWSLTKHAQQRFAERAAMLGVTMNDIYLTCDKPERTYESLDVPGSWRYVRGNVSLIVNPTQKRVVTVMPDTWDDRSIEHVRT